MHFKDIHRVRRLTRYLRKEKRRLLLIGTILLPVALAGAIQPLLVGQAISLLRGEETFSWLQSYSLNSALRILVFILLLFYVVAP